MDFKQILHTVKTSKYATWVVHKRRTQIQDGGRPNIWRLAHFRFWHAHLSTHFSDEQNLQFN